MISGGPVKKQHPVQWIMGDIVTGDNIVNSIPSSLLHGVVKGPAF